MYRIVVADDHVMFAEGVRGLLLEQGVGEVIGVAENDQVAVRLVGELRPDVVILDSALPNQGGAAVASAIHDSQPALSIVMLADESQTEAGAFAFRSGVRGIVARQRSTSELVSAIAIVTKRGIYCDAVFAESYHRSHPEESLTPTETAVLTQLALGLTAKEVARTLNLSPRTIEHARERLKWKVGQQTLAGLIRYAIRTGLADP